MEKVESGKGQRGVVEDAWMAGRGRQLCLMPVRNAIWHTHFHCLASYTLSLAASSHHPHHPCLSPLPSPASTPCINILCCTTPRSFCHFCSLPSLSYAV